MTMSAEGFTPEHASGRIEQPLDLQQFCGWDDEPRTYARRPNSVGNYTYATNGHIIVRVPRVAGAAETDKPVVPWERALAGIDKAVFLKVPASVVDPHIPHERKKVLKGCPECDGSGTEHDCPNCDCECEYCEGSGTVEVIQETEISTSVFGVPVNLRYVSLVLALPGVEITAPALGGVWFFRFDGGVGAVMPLSRPYKQHVDIGFPIEPFACTSLPNGDRAGENEK